MSPGFRTLKQDLIQKAVQCGDRVPGCRLVVCSCLFMGGAPVRLMFVPVVINVGFSVSVMGVEVMFTQILTVAFSRVICVIVGNPFWRRSGEGCVRGLVGSFGVGSPMLWGLAFRFTGGEPRRTRGTGLPQYGQ